MQLAMLVDCLAHHPMQGWMPKEGASFYKNPLGSHFCGLSSLESVDGNKVLDYKNNLLHTNLILHQTSSVFLGSTI
jgi:hypothetical protein